MREPFREPGSSMILRQPEEISDVTAEVSFDAARAPNDRRPTLVTASVSIEATGGNEGRVETDVDGETTAYAIVDTAAGGLTANPDVTQTESVTFLVPAGSTYTIRNVLDPAATNTIDGVHEATL